MSDLSEKTTVEILTAYKIYIQGLAIPVSTEEIDEILENRVISEEEDPEVDPALRGGIHPTRRP